MLFQLYMLVNTDIIHAYTYVGVSKETNRIIQIHKEQVSILKQEDSVFFENDYLLTSRFIDFDLPYLDNLFHVYTNQKEYSIITRFNEEKHTTLTYHSPTNESAKDYDIFLGYPDKRAEKLVEDIYTLINDLQKRTFELDN